MSRIDEIKARRANVPKIGYLVTSLSTLKGGHECVRLLTSDVDFLLAEIERLRQGLWDCAKYAGIDTDGNDTPRSLTSDLLRLAVGAVQEQRRDYDDLLDELPLTKKADW